MDRAAMKSAFAERFGRPCRALARAPGRVNLIGEHTDYNEGFVLPIACEQSTWAACDGRDDARACVVSNSLASQYEWTPGDWRASDAPHWSGYVAGVADLLRERGAAIGGFDMLIASDVPVGGGLSSSAALEVAAAKALAYLAGHAIDDEQLAILCRRAEHEYAGVPCGIMDQTISILGRAGTALLLDCRDRSYEHVPLPLGDKTVVVIDSRVRHELADGEYAQRQRQCGDAVRFFQGLDPSVRSLRDVSGDAVAAHAGGMDPLAARRARHVVGENRRVLEASAALKGGDFATFGRLMAESHRSLRDDYEVSCPELDRLVEISAASRGVIGARMTGDGFGGCVVAIVQRDAIAELTKAVDAGYLGPQGRKATIIVTRPAAGASIEMG